MLLGMRIHVGVLNSDTGADISGVVVQGSNSSYQVVAMVGREMLVMEAARPDLEWGLLAACWCMHKLARYTMYVPWVEIAVPQATMLVALDLKVLHCKL